LAASRIADSKAGQMRVEQDGLTFLNALNDDRARHGPVGARRGEGAGRED
jgi:hypothetical protein